MSKELQALREMYQVCLVANVVDMSKDYELVESALKRLENFEQNEDFNKDVLNYAFLNEQDKIKKLKALEIIKEKKS